MMLNGKFTTYVAYGVAGASFVGGWILAFNAYDGWYVGDAFLILLRTWLLGLILFTVLTALGAIQSNQTDLIELIKSINQLQIKQSESTIERKIHIINSSYPATSNEVEQINISAADEIEKFKRLLDNDIITKDEFEFKKKQLLGMNTNGCEQESVELSQEATTESNSNSQYKGLYY